MNSGLMGHYGLLINVYDPAAQDVIDRMNTPPAGTHGPAINDLVVGLKSAGYWDRIDSLYIPKKMGTQTDSLLDWRRSTKTATINGSVTWDNALGFVGSTAAGSYVDPDFIPSSDGVNYKLNDCSMAAYITALPSVSNVNYFGKIGGTANQALYLGTGNHVTGTLEGKINSSAGGASLSGKAATGLNAIGRTASNAWEIGVNGVTEYTDTDTSGGLSTLGVYILAVNNAGVASAMADSKIAAWYAGDYFTTAEQAEIKALFDTYWAAF